MLLRAGVVWTCGVYRVALWPCLMALGQSAPMLGPLVLGLGARVIRVLGVIQVEV